LQYGRNYAIWRFYANEEVPLEPLESTEFILLSGCEVMECPELVPAERGVYMVFLEGGRKLLERTGYHLTETEEPLSIDDKVHLYTGAAKDLRRRIVQHFLRDVRTSNFRKTLFSIEDAKQAVSRSGTPKCRIKDERTLGLWLYRNALVAVGCTDRHFEAERILLSRFASPFNIRARRSSLYAQALIGWREAAFPARNSRTTRPRMITRKPSTAYRNVAVN
jgi:hypothetical protein